MMDQVSILLVFWLRLMNEAQLLLDEGGDILQIDREMNLFGFPVGPITLADEVGIDVGAHIMSGELMHRFA
jgi:3-hydroxyacyl-CoA dehydrogenase